MKLLSENVIQQPRIWNQHQRSCLQILLITLDFGDMTCRSCWNYVDFSGIENASIFNDKTEKCHND